MKQGDKVYYKNIFDIPTFELVNYIGKDYIFIDHHFVWTTHNDQIRFCTKIKKSKVFPV